MIKERFTYGANEKWEDVLIDHLTKKEYDLYELDKLCNDLWNQTQRFEKHNQELVQRSIRYENIIDELKRDNDIKFWKHEFMQQWNNTQIILYELALAIDEGYEVSDAFKDYMDDLKGKHDENLKKAQRLGI